MSTKKRTPAWGKWVEPPAYDGKGERIKSLRELVDAANERRSVVIPSRPGLDKPKPAAIVVHMPAMIVHEMLTRGIFLYERKVKI